MKVFFFCYPQGPPDKAGYQHQTVVLAEGFKQLGVNFSGNINYWMQRPGDAASYLIQNDSQVNWQECDLVIVPTTFVDYNGIHLLPKNLFQKDRRYKLVVIDGSDGLVTPGYMHPFNMADVILKSHYCKKYNYPVNMVPWAFGLSNRIIQTIKPLPFDQRLSETLNSFRVALQARVLMAERVMPIIYNRYPANNEIDQIVENKAKEDIDKLYWEQTGRRHNPDFYRRLAIAKLCNAVGGNFQKMTDNLNHPFMQFLRKAERKLNVLPYDRIFQFDSWRFWESLAAGCCTIQVDFEKFGLVMPVMPEAFKHYLPVAFKYNNKLVRVLQDDAQIAAIAAEGRQWAIKYYSPLATTQRLMNVL